MCTSCRSGWSEHCNFDILENNNKHTYADVVPLLASIRTTIRRDTDHAI